jgi:hypothetical protein
MDRGTLPRGPLESIPDLLPYGVKGLLGIETLSRFPAIAMDWEKARSPFYLGRPEGSFVPHIHEPAPAVRSRSSQTARV